MTVYVIRVKLPEEKRAILLSDSGRVTRLRIKAVGAMHMDQQRFPRREDGIYESADYDTAKYHAEVTLNGGATSVTVH